MKPFIIIFFVVNSLYCLGQTAKNDIKDCDRMLSEAQQCSDSGNYELAIKKLSAVTVHCPDMTSVVNQRLFKIYTDINNAKQSEKIAKEKALTERDIAVSKELLVNAEKEIKSDPQLSLNLIILAAEKQLHTDGALSPETRASLLRVTKVNSKEIPLQIKYTGMGTGGVESFAISPDESKIAIGNQDSTILVMDTKSYRILFKLKQHWTESVKWSSDGKLIASSGQNDGSVNIWDGTTGRNLKSFIYSNAGAPCVDWRINSHVLAYVITEKVIVYDYDQDRVLFEVPGFRAAWSPDGNMIATGGWDEHWSLILFKSDGTMICQLPGHNRYVNSVCWTKDNNYLVTASVDDQVIIWDARACSNMLTIHQKFPLCASWSPDGRYLAVGGGAEAVKIYAVKNNFTVLDSISYSTTITGDKIEEGSISGYILNLCWSKNGNYLVLGDRAKTVTYYDARLFGIKSDRVLLDVAHSLRRRELTAGETRQYLTFR